MNNNDGNENYNNKKSKGVEKRLNNSPIRRYHEGYQPESNPDEIKKPRKVIKVIKSPTERDKGE